VRWLWPEFIRVVSEIRPNWVVAENPLGLNGMDVLNGLFEVESGTFEEIPDQYSAGLDEICGQIEQIGYEVQTFVIPACGVGALHQRYRIFVVGYASRGGLSGKESQDGCSQWSVIPNSECKRRQHGESERLGEIPKRGNDDSLQITEPDCNDTNSTIRGLQKPKSKDTGVDNETQKEGCTQTGPVERPCIITNSQQYPECDRRDAKSGLGGMVDGFSCWLHEPDGIPRVATGIKNRADRLKCLGNAVVPQQVYPILKAIAEIERGG
jgi:DNA (cytosine-5)-methyltransferase 1